MLYKLGFVFIAFNAVHQILQLFHVGPFQDFPAIFPRMQTWCEIQCLYVVTGIYEIYIMNYGLKME